MNSTQAAYEKWKAQQEAKARKSQQGNIFTGAIAPVAVGYLANDFLSGSNATSGLSGLETFGAEMGYAPSASETAASLQQGIDSLGVGGGFANSFTSSGASLTGASAPYTGQAGLAGLYGAYNLWGQNPKRVGTGKGYLQGAASGAGIGYAIGGPIGAGIGAGVGLIGNAFGGKSRTKVEEERREDLAKQGITVPTTKDAPHDKEWELNPEFAATRDESKAKGSDINTAATFYQNITGWGDLPEELQNEIAQEAITRGLAREHHGTWDISFDDEDYSKYITDTINKYKASQEEKPSSDSGSRSRTITVKTEKSRPGIGTIMNQISQMKPAKIPQASVPYASVPSVYYGSSLAQPYTSK